MSRWQVDPPLRAPVDTVRPLQAWMRLSAFALVLLVGVLLPFALWGDALEQAAPAWLATQEGRFWFAAIGVALLVADVVLPVPSSLVAIALCWSLGPLAGGAAVAVGGLLSFASGYGMGRLLPEPRLRRWIGEALWDRVRDRARHRAAWWIVLTRPLPVLAELSAVLAGVWRLPVGPALAQAGAASIALGALYGGSAWLGARTPGALATFAVLLLLPMAFWATHRWWLRRLASSSVVRVDGTGSAARRK